MGVKIYLGHEGKPCPRSAAALIGFQEYIHMQPNNQLTGDVLGQVATEMQIPITEVLRIVSDALRNGEGSMTEMARKVLNLAAEKAGLNVLDLIHYLNCAFL